MLPRMRTIDAAAACLRETDPETAFTKTALRRLVVSGQLPSVRIGTKYLLDLDTLEDYLRGNMSLQAEEISRIRRVEL